MVLAPLVVTRSLGAQVEPKTIKPGMTEADVRAVYDGISSSPMDRKPQATIQ
jgi:hypothetical protein